MPPSAMELVVLCGGRGVRLRPYTDQVPKALVPVAGRPIIDHVVDFLTGQGLDRIHLCVGYKGGLIADHFAPPRPLLKVAVSDDGEDASMLRRLHSVIAGRRGRFLVAYCDTFIDIDVRRLEAFHCKCGALATIVTAPIRNPFGIVTFDRHGTVESFHEKPVNHHFIGLSILEATAFELVDDSLLDMPDGAGLIALFHRLIAAKRLVAFEHGGLNITFNTVGEKVQAEQALAHYHTLAEDNEPRTSE